MGPYFHCCILSLLMFDMLQPPEKVCPNATMCGNKGIQIICNEYKLIPPLESISAGSGMQKYL